MHHLKANILSQSIVYVYVTMKMLSVVIIVVLSGISRTYVRRMSQLNKSTFLDCGYCHDLADE